MRFACRKAPGVLPHPGGSFRFRDRIQRQRQAALSKTLRFLVCPTGVEPVTFGSGGRRSIQLSYGHVSAKTASKLALSPTSNPWIVPTLRIVVLRRPFTTRLETSRGQPPMRSGAIPSLGESG